jgi:hypothetical protein
LVQYQSRFADAAIPENFVRDCLYFLFVCRSILVFEEKQKIQAVLYDLQEIFYFILGKFFGSAFIDILQ